MEMTRVWLRVVGVVLTALMLSAQAAWSGTLTVTNGLVAWLKADALTGLTNGQAVAKWMDSSPAGHDAVQSDTAKQPVCIRDGQNGLPVVRFDGDRAGSGTQADNLSLTSRALANLSFFMVIKPVNGLNTYALTFGSDHRGLVYGFESNLTKWDWFEDRFVPLTDVSSGQFQIVSCTEASALCDMLWFVGSDIGSTAPFAGEMAELLVYDRALSVAERRAVNDYLVKKWDVPPVQE